MAGHPGTAKTAENEATWNKQNSKAIIYTYNSIFHDKREFIGKETTAVGILIKFDKLCFKEFSSLQICVQNKLDRIRLGNYNVLGTFFTCFERTIKELKSTSDRVNEA